MSRSRTLLLAVAAFALAALLPASAGATASADGSGPAASAAAKKKCKKPAKRVKVRSKGKTRTVCRKRSAKGPKGPSVAEVESIIRGQMQASHQTWLGPESIEVIFEKPTQVRPRVKYNPYEADPLTATGKIDAWPVRAWVKSIDHKDDTPEDDITWGGCLGHLNDFWPYDSLYMFFRGQSGEWTFLSSTAKPGDCG